MLKDSNPENPDNWKSEYGEWLWVGKGSSPLKIDRLDNFIEEPQNLHGLIVQLNAKDLSMTISTLEEYVIANRKSLKSVHSIEKKVKIHRPESAQIYSKSMLERIFKGFSFDDYSPPKRDREKVGEALGYSMPRICLVVHPIKVIGLATTATFGLGYILFQYLSQ